MTENDKLLWIIVRVPGVNQWTTELWGLSPEIDIGELKRGDSVSSIELLRARVYPSSIEDPIDYLDPPCEFIGAFRPETRNRLNGMLAESRASGSVQFELMHETILTSFASQWSIQEGDRTPLGKIASESSENGWIWLIVHAQQAPIGQHETILLISLSPDSILSWLDSHGPAFLGDTIPNSVLINSREFLGFGIGDASIIARLPEQVSTYLSACRPHFVAHHGGPIGQAKLLATAGVQMARPSHPFVW